MVTSARVGISWRLRLIVVLARTPSGSGNRRPAPVWRRRAAHLRRRAELDPSLINLQCPTEISRLYMADAVLQAVRDHAFARALREHPAAWPRREDAPFVNHLQ